MPSKRLQSRDRPFTVNTDMAGLAAISFVDILDVNLLDLHRNLFVVCNLLFQIFKAALHAFNFSRNPRLPCGEFRERTLQPILFLLQQRTTQCYSIDLTLKLIHFGFVFRLLGLGKVVLRLKKKSACILQLFLVKRQLFMQSIKLRGQLFVFFLSCLALKCCIGFCKLSFKIGKLYDVVAPDADALSVTFSEKGQLVGDARQMYTRTNPNKVGVVAKDGTDVKKKATWFFPGDAATLNRGEKVLIIGQDGSFYKVRRAELGSGNWTEGFIKSNELNLQ